MSLSRAAMANGPQPPLNDRTIGCDCSLLYIQDTLFICFPFLLLMRSVAAAGGRYATVRGMGIEDPDLKESALLAVVPKVLGCDV